MPDQLLAEPSWSQESCVQQLCSRLSLTKSIERSHKLPLDVAIVSRSHSTAGHKAVDHGLPASTVVVLKTHSWQAQKVCSMTPRVLTEPGSK